MTNNIYIVIFRQMTVTDLIERSIKKGRGIEQAAAARVVPLLCIQLGGGENLCRDLNPILTTTALDPAVPYDARGKVNIKFIKMLTKP